MVGYNITSMNQGSLTGVKVLMCTTSFMTLNERVLLVPGDDAFEISIMEMKLINKAIDLVKKGIKGHSNSQVKGTRLINKAIEPSVLGLNTSSA